MKPRIPSKLAPMPRASSPIALKIELGSVNAAHSGTSTPLASTGNARRVEVMLTSTGCYKVACAADLVVCCY